MDPEMSAIRRSTLVNTRLGNAGIISFTMLFRAPSLRIENVNPGGHDEGRDHEREKGPVHHLDSQISHKLSQHMILSKGSTLKSIFKF